MVVRSGDGSGRAGGDRGGRSGGRSKARSKPQDDDLKNWVPLTKLGRLVASGKITTLEEIFLHSIPIKEYQIVDFFYRQDGCEHPLQEEVMKIIPVQKQTRAGQMTRFKAFVAIGDCNGHIGLGIKRAKEVATAIRGAIIDAKLNIIPVRRGYWGANIGDPHTVPLRVSGKCGSVGINLIPAPRGAHIVGSPITKKLLHFAGIQDCYSASRGSTKTRGNFMKALYCALKKSYNVMTSDLWRDQPLVAIPMDRWSEYLLATDDKKTAKA